MAMAKGISGAYAEDLYKKEHPGNPEPWKKYNSPLAILTRDTAYAWRGVEAAAERVEAAAKRAVLCPFRRLGADPALYVVPGVLVGIGTFVANPSVGNSLLLGVVTSAALAAATLFGAPSCDSAAPVPWYAYGAGAVLSLIGALVGPTPGVASALAIVGALGGIVAVRAARCVRVDGGRRACLVRAALYYPDPDAAASVHAAYQSVAGNPKDRPALGSLAGEDRRTGLARR